MTDFIQTRQRRFMLGLPPVEIASGAQATLVLEIPRILYIEAFVIAPDPPGVVPLIADLDRRPIVFVPEPGHDYSYLLVPGPFEARPFSTFQLRVVNTSGNTITVRAALSGWVPVVAEECPACAAIETGNSGFCGDHDRGFLAEVDRGTPMGDVVAALIKQSADARARRN